MKDVVAVRKEVEFGGLAARWGLQAIWVSGAWVAAGKSLKLHNKETEKRGEGEKRGRGGKEPPQHTKEGDTYGAKKKGAVSTRVTKLSGPEPLWQNWETVIQ